MIKKTLQDVADFEMGTKSEIYIKTEEITT